MEIIRVTLSRRYPLQDLNSRTLLSQEQKS